MAQSNSTANNTDSGIELDYTLPDKTTDFCRSKIDRMGEKYEQRIRENPENDLELRQEFYERVPDKLESCKPPPTLVNISDRPDSIPEECGNRLKSLNQEIMNETDAEIGSVIPEKYREEYEKRLKGCVASGALQKLEKIFKNKLMESDNPDFLIDTLEGFFDRVIEIVLKNPEKAENIEINSSVKN
ncbi:MAG: hypothetical protein BRC29_00480 [Nanohaloarchaea archaeon SW_7_43_1]|nr:MAG: hypothetical protein BRC29_00480 [Nanohaloarchaea archaeon SW_7_43_1]